MNASRLFVAMMLVCVAAPRPCVAAEDPQAAARGAVVRALDGETLEVKLGDRVVLVRHIGIRTPTLDGPVAGSQAYHRRAATAHAALVEGREVALHFDVATRNAAGATLAHAMVDGRLVSADLVSRGFAEVATVPPNVRYREYLRALQAKAQAERAGLWADPDVPRSYRPARSGVIASLRTMSFFHVDDDKGWREDLRRYFDSPEAAREAGFAPSFEYGLHAERELRSVVAPVTPEAESVTVSTVGRPTEASPPVALPARVPKGHVWRGGVFIPIW